MPCAAAVRSFRPKPSAATDVGARSFRPWIVVGVLAAVSGCALVPQYVWRKPDVSAADARADEAACDQQAAVIRAEPAPYGGKGQGLLIAEQERRAQEAFETCMRTKGYRRERVSAGR